MKRIKQRTISDCVIAAIACLTDHSYKAVKDKCGPVKGGLERHEIEWLLTALGIQWRRYRIRKPVPAPQWASNHQVRAMLVIEPLEVGSEIYHVVATDNGEVFDPSDGSNGSQRDVIAAYVF